MSSAHCSSASPLWGCRGPCGLFHLKLNSEQLPCTATYVVSTRKSKGFVGSRSTVSMQDQQSRGQGEEGLLRPEIATAAIEPPTTSDPWLLQREAA